MRPRTYVWAVGDDANLPLLQTLTKGNGLLEWVRSTEPVDFKLNAFLAKIGRTPVEGLSLAVDPAANTQLIYPLEPSTFPGSMAAWVGQYKAPGNANFTVRGNRDGVALNLKASLALPAQSLDHPQLPRTWAKARVHALLEKIDREGEYAPTIE